MKNRIVRGIKRKPLWQVKMLALELGDSFCVALEAEIRVRGAATTFNFRHKHRRLTVHKRAHNIQVRRWNRWIPKVSTLEKVSIA